jgi:hypothetical protein
VPLADAYSSPWVHKFAQMRKRRDLQRDRVCAPHALSTSEPEGATDNQLAPPRATVKGFALGLTAALRVTVTRGSACHQSGRGNPAPTPTST